MEVKDAFRNLLGCIRYSFQLLGFTGFIFVLKCICLFFPQFKEKAGRAVYEHVVLAGITEEDAIDSISRLASWNGLMLFTKRLYRKSFCQVNVGTKAVNSTVLTLDEGKEVKLFEFMRNGRPLVLNFGSCT
jgi:hypothetical protein